MVIKGKKIGDYESSQRTDWRTWIKIQFVESPKNPGKFFLYDMETGSEPVPIGWLNDLDKLTLVPGQFKDIKSGLIKEIRLIYLRSATGYHPFYNSNPHGFNNKHGRQDVHSRPPLQNE